MDIQKVFEKIRNPIEDVIESMQKGVYLVLQSMLLITSPEKMTILKLKHLIQSLITKHVMKFVNGGLNDGV